METPEAARIRTARNARERERRAKRKEAEAFERRARARLAGAVPAGQSAAPSVDAPPGPPPDLDVLVADPPTPELSQGLPDETMSDSDSWQASGALVDLDALEAVQLDANDGDQRPPVASDDEDGLPDRVFSSHESLPSPVRLSWPAKQANSALFRAALLRQQSKHRLSDATLGSLLESFHFVQAASLGSGIDVPLTKGALLSGHKRDCHLARLPTTPLMRETVVCPACCKIFGEEPEPEVNKCGECGARLFSAGRSGLVAAPGSRVPVRTYHIARLSDVAERLMQTPGFTENIRFPYTRWDTSELPDVLACDVYDGALWKQMAQEKFLVSNKPFNLAVSVYIDWLPKGKWRMSSHGVVILIVQNLPYELRFALHPRRHCVYRGTRETMLTP